MNEDDQWEEDRGVIDAMATYGGSFVTRLAEAAMVADGQNLARIKATWPEYWSQYKAMAKRKQERKTT